MQTVYLTPVKKLRVIYSHGSRSGIRLGEHVGSGNTPCFADTNELFGKHSAVLGSTGSGKSSAVAAILHAVIEHGEENKYSKWHPCIVILDPHNEYGSAFPDTNRLSIDEGTLSIPYWVLNLQETIALFIGRTEFTATSIRNIVKNAL